MVLFENMVYNEKLDLIDFPVKLSLLKMFKAFTECLENMATMLSRKNCLIWVNERWRKATESRDQLGTNLIKEPYVVLPYNLADEIDDFPMELKNAYDDFSKFRKNFEIVLRLYLLK